MNCVRSLVRWLPIVLFATLPTRALAAFGVISSGGYYTVDTGAGLVFKVSQSSGDITSLVYNGTEYQATDKNSHLASGLGTATVTATTYSNSIIKITLTTSASNTVVSNLTHYLMVRNGYNIIYLATYATAEPAVGELRWITRLRANLVSNGPLPSDTRNNTGAIESSDVFGMADGTSRSKYYGRHRALELNYTGATGPGIGVFMVFDNPRESGSGGPFYRDIENQCGTDQEVYNYMNSGHAQTEPWRTNVLHGPYALVFTSGTPPVLPLDYSWLEPGGLGLTGWVSKSNRGAVSGVVSGVPAGFQAVIGFANTTAQYWAVAGTNGNYATPLMKPGTYRAILYKDELEVATNTVTVTAGQTNILNPASTEPAPTFLFKIGEWDGTPTGFLNADRILDMHPSDARMDAWGPVTFTVGVDPMSAFPMASWQDTNNPTTVRFNLSSLPLTSLNLRIGITCAYAGARPNVTVNSWNSAIPASSTQPNTRTLTLGTWRGNNWLYTYSVPASAFVLGTNTLIINMASGSGSLSPFLSPGDAFDAVELDVPNTTPPLPAAPNVLAATNAPGARVSLSWRDNSSNEVNFLVERSLDNTNFTLIAAVTAGITNYSDAGLLPGATYFYRVRASNRGGNSSYSNTASATIPLPRITNVSLSTGNLIMSGADGSPNGGYYVLATTNAALPATLWTRITTNLFDANGNFSFSTPATSAQKFLLLQLQ